ncbi:type IV toxin-antitoxin system AbiEi family antitoxin domain-containing protein [Actinoallomurus liliacearum]|uniref:Type IV toxin-antitoxin system AbiEi family antitoxin domain-containing protein n=1 Tax=Actinoallomurus liliacearum TaxID=1080073 RepID=A0ABP8TUC4_9ACTN
MADTSSASLARLERLPATFLARMAREIGMAPHDLYRLRDEGAIQELSRGVFRKAAAPEGQVDLLAVALRAPLAVVCLDSALALHGLVDEIPAKLHIAVPRGTTPPRVDYPPVQVHRFHADTFEIGVEMYEAAPSEWVRIYSAARSVVDAMRLRHLVGDVFALRALRTSLENGAARPGELVDLARTLGVGGAVLQAIEVMLS